VEYEAGGASYKESHSVCGSAGRVSVGDTVAIFCNPDNPSEARYRSDFNGLAQSVAMITMGALTAFIGILLLYR
jgi:hypothetical protein